MGSSNTALGANALLGVTGTSTGSNNTAVGDTALYQSTSGLRNTAVGYQAGYNTNTGAGNTTLGYAAKAGTSANNTTSVGQYAGSSIMTGTNNTMIGGSAGQSLTTGQGNTFVGNAGYVDQGSGGLITTGSKNAIFGAYNGNQNGLDIRTLSHTVLLSDGDGRPHKFSQLFGNLMGDGVGHFENVLYEGNATGWDSTASINTWTTITAIDFNDIVLREGNGVIVKIMLYTTNLNPTYGYYSLSLAHILNLSANTSYNGTTTATSDGTGNKGGELPVTSQCHTATTTLDFRLRIANVTGVGRRLQAYSNIAPSATASAPTLKISATRHNHY